MQTISKTPQSTTNPTPTTDISSYVDNDWQSYSFEPIVSDGLNSFSISYPADLQLTSNPSNSGFYLEKANQIKKETVAESDANSSQTNYRLDFSLVSLEGNQTLEQKVDSILDDNFVSSFITKQKTEYKASNYLGWEYSYNTAEPFHFFVLQPNQSGDWYLQVTLTGNQDLELTNRILSTLEFSK